MEHSELQDTRLGNQLQLLTFRNLRVRPYSWQHCTNASWALASLGPWLVLWGASSSAWPLSWRRTFFTMSSLNFAWCSFKLFLCILSPVTKEERSVPSPGTPPRRKLLPLSFFFSRLNNPCILRHYHFSLSLLPLFRYNLKFLYPSCVIEPKIACSTRSCANGKHGIFSSVNYNVLNAPQDMLVFLSIRTHCWSILNCPSTKIPKTSWKHSGHLSPISTATFALFQEQNPAFTFFKCCMVGDCPML